MRLTVARANPRKTLGRELAATGLVNVTEAATRVPRGQGEGWKGMTDGLKAMIEKKVDRIFVLCLLRMIHVLGCLRGYHESRSLHRLGDVAQRQSLGSFVALPGDG